MTAKTRQLRALLAGSDFLYMPSTATPIEGKLAEAAGTKLVHTGGYVTGASRAITEPLGTGPSPANALVAAVIANNAGATLVNFISVPLKLLALRSGVTVAGVLPPPSLTAPETVMVKLSRNYYVHPTKP